MVVAGPCSFDWLGEGSWRSPLNNNVTEKMPWEKNWSGGGKLKTSWILTITAFSPKLTGRDGGGGTLFPWLTEWGQPAQPMGWQLYWKKNLWEKVSNGGRENKDERRTHGHCLLHAACEQGMAAAGSYLPCRLREGRWHCRLDSNFIEKRSCEKKFWMVGGK